MAEITQHTLSNQFRKASPKARIKELQKLIDASQSPPPALSAEEMFQSNSGLLEIADKSIENCIGNISLPIGVVPNLQIDGMNVHVPLATEEPSIIAGASYAAKIFSSAGLNSNGGIQTSANPPLQIAQIALLNVSEEGERKFIDSHREIVDALLSFLESMQKRGGGIRRVEHKRISSGGVQGLFVVHLTIDVRDAMGANIANSTAEFIAPKIAEITGGTVLASIMSNFSVERTAKAEILLDIKKLPTKGKSHSSVAQYIDYMSKWATVDIYRASTHNKGIMNALSSLAIVTGNDARAIEAAAHSLAASLGATHVRARNEINASNYSSLSQWEYIDHQHILRGNITIPALFATKGGSTQHPSAQWVRRILGINYAKEMNAPMLNRIAAGLALAQNFAALLALCTEGIQRGHMNLHERKSKNQ